MSSLRPDGQVPSGLLEVGRVGRPHGIRGDVFMDLTSDRVERVAVGSRLWVHNAWREITSSAVAGDRWRVHFSGVDDRNAAQLLTGTPAYAEPIDDPDALWVHRLIGARVFDSAGVDRGTCVAVVENPAADLVELEDGTLIPATFITGIEPVNQSTNSATSSASGAQTVIRVDVPEGLFELFDTTQSADASDD